MSDKPIDPQGCLRQIWEFAPQYAHAKANRVYCEEFRKSLKAKLMKDSGEKTAAAAEVYAYAHADYIGHLEGLRAAVEEEEALRWRLVVSQAAIEVWRSQESSNRAMDRGTR